MTNFNVILRNKLYKECLDVYLMFLYRARFIRSHLRKCNDADERNLATSFLNIILHFSGHLHIYHRLFFIILFRIYVSDYTSIWMLT